jgi:hypothetical protein
MRKPSAIPRCSSGELLTRLAFAVAGCQVLPSDNIWNTPVADLPLDGNSAAYVATIGADAPAHPDFGAGLWRDGPIGIPYTVTVGSAQAPVALRFEWPDESDPGPYPIPTDAPIEGGPDASGDRHILVVDRERCVAYEVYRAVWQPDGSIEAGSGAVFDLGSHALRPAGWTSADAAGLPILPGLVRYEEVAAGAVHHAIRFTAPETRRAYVWPARHFASRLVDARYPPMGQRFRLQADVDLTGMAPPARVVAEALKTYGMILADNGSPWFLSGAPDERWNNEALRDLRRLRGRDFEAVDVSSLMDDPDSGRLRASPSPTQSPAGDRRLYLPWAWTGPSRAVGLHQAPRRVALRAVGTAFNNPIGIDYHQPTNRVVMSVNYPEGRPYNSDLVDADGSRERFSMAAGWTEEVKIATVRDGPCTGGFTPGELFSGSGRQGVVARVAYDGARVGAAGHSSRARRVDPDRYGPWAGTILAGAEGQSRIYAVDTAGRVTTWDLGLAPRPPRAPSPPLPRCRSPYTCPRSRRSATDSTRTWFWCWMPPRACWPMAVPGSPRWKPPSARPRRSCGCCDCQTTGPP